MNSITLAIHSFDPSLSTRSILQDCGRKKTSFEEKNSVSGEIALLCIDFQTDSCQPNSNEKLVADWKELIHHSLQVHGCIMLESDNLDSLALLLYQLRKRAKVTVAAG